MRWFILAAAVAGLAVAFFSPAHTVPGTPRGQALGATKTISGTFKGKGVECPIMIGDDGHTYALTFAPGALDVGDTIVVLGKSMMFGTCMQGSLIAVDEVRKLSPAGDVLKVWTVGKS